VSDGGEDEDRYADWDVMQSKLAATILFGRTAGWFVNGMFRSKSSQEGSDGSEWLSLFCYFYDLGQLFFTFLLLMRCPKSTFSKKTRYFGTYGAFPTFWLARARTSSYELEQAQKSFLQVY
jgi:hypothetical protein